MLTSAPAVSSSSAEMQRGGKWWSETPRLVSCRVAPLRAVCVQPLGFARTGLTGECDRPDRWCGAGSGNRSDQLSAGRIGWSKV